MWYILLVISIIGIAYGTTELQKITKEGERMTKKYYICTLVLILSSFGVGYIAHSDKYPQITVTNTNNSYNKTDKINLNTAPLKAIKSLDGVGEDKAMSIVANRPYSSIYDVVGINGISFDTIERNKNRIEVSLK